MKNSLICVVFFAILLSACSVKPVIYPDENYKSAGKSQANADIDQCMKEAKEDGVEGESAGSKVAKRAGAGSVAGAAGTSVGQVIHSGTVTGRGVAAGAAGGAVSTSVWSIFYPPHPDNVFKIYVERCLRDKGYQVVEWK